MLKKFVSLLLFFVSITAFAEEFVAGKDYIVLPASSTEAPTSNLIPVKEFFSYGCPWCFKLEPNLENWVAAHKEKIEFTRIPVVFKKDWELYAKAYYTAH